MNTSPLRYFILFPVLITLLSCVTGDSTRSAEQAQVPGVFNHKAAHDTVDWRTLRDDGSPLVVPETDLEWPGEQMGLVGPIVATGGSGSKRYVLVYDPAGVLVGGMTRKEVKKNPERFEQLLRLAHERGEVQNMHALQIMVARKIQAEMTAAAERRTP